MNSVTEKFLSWLNDKIDGYGKNMSVDEMIALRSAQAQIKDADRPDFIAAKKTSKVFTADANGWSYLKCGADLHEFLADAIEFMLSVGLQYCVRCAEHRVRNIWKTLPPSWQTQPIYDILYKFKERDDLNLRSNIEHAMKHCKVNPSVFLEIVLKNDSGAVNRRANEAAERAAMAQRLEVIQGEKARELTDRAFKEIHAMPDYQERFDECVEWYKKRYPRSFIDITAYPQCIDSYLVNLTQRGGYENFDNRNDDNQTAGQTESLDKALLENE